jgi:hypothetical protein
MGRLPQITLIASTLGLAWSGMQAGHELGHVACAWAGGETVERVVLHPLVFSRTDVTHDRHPLLVIWGGPAVGTLLPLAAWGVSKLTLPDLAYLTRFFAGFCLIANGAYLGVGSIECVGDAGDLLRYGAPRWALIAYGLSSVPVGLYLWHGRGRHFGLGEARGRVDRRASVGTLCFFLAVLLVEVLIDSR